MSKDFSSSTGNRKIFCEPGPILLIDLNDQPRASLSLPRGHSSSQASTQYSAQPKGSEMKSSSGRHKKSQKSR